MEDPSMLKVRCINSRLVRFVWTEIQTEQASKVSSRRYPMSWEVWTFVSLYLL